MELLADQEIFASRSVLLEFALPPQFLAPTQLLETASPRCARPPTDRASLSRSPELAAMMETNARRTIDVPLEFATELSSTAIELATRALTPLATFLLETAMSLLSPTDRHATMMDLSARLETLAPTDFASKELEPSATALRLATQVSATH